LRLWQASAGVDPYTGKENPYPVFPNIEECKVEADVVVDFAAAPAVDKLLDYCVARQVPVVLCTTGLSEAQLARVEEAGRQVAVLKSANMSLGINMLLDLLQKAAKVLAPAGFDMEIVEKHHNQKVDAPSGTALALADAMNAALGQEYAYQYDRTQERKKREKKILWIRMGSLMTYFMSTSTVMERMIMVMKSMGMGRMVMESIAIIMNILANIVMRTIMRE